MKSVGAWISIERRVGRVLDMVKRNEYKRRAGAPGVRVQPAGIWTGLAIPDYETGYRPFKEVGVACLPDFPPRLLDVGPVSLRD